MILPFVLFLLRGARYGTVFAFFGASGPSPPTNFLLRMPVPVAVAPSLTYSQ